MNASRNRRESAAIHGNPRDAGGTAAIHEKAEAPGVRGLRGMELGGRLSNPEFIHRIRGAIRRIAT
jgi:hypothetical protein